MPDTTAPPTPDRRPALIVLAILLAATLAGGGYIAGRASKDGKAAGTGTTASTNKGLQLGALGKVESVNGETIVLKTRNGQRNITLTDQTKVLTSTAAPDGTTIQPGENLVVESSRDSSGKLTAVRIVILPGQ